jgi:hypothetical protein
MKTKTLSTQEKNLFNQCFGVPEIEAEDGLIVQEMFKLYALDQVMGLINQLEQETIKKIKQIKNQELQILLTKLLI